MNKKLIPALVVWLGSVCWLVWPDARWEPALALFAATSTVLALLAIGRQPFHPPNTEKQRSQLHKCRFTIDPTWQSAMGWSGHGDVLVEFANPLGRGNVYLIPSGLTRQELRDPRAFDRRPELLDLKREATSEFIRTTKSRPLSGFWFTISVGGEQKVKVYCKIYDRFLNKYAAPRISTHQRSAVASSSARR